MPVSVHQPGTTGLTNTGLTDTGLTDTGFIDYAMPKHPTGNAHAGMSVALSTPDGYAGSVELTGSTLPILISHSTGDPASGTTATLSNAHPGSTGMVSAADGLGDDAQLGHHNYGTTAMGD